MPLTDNEINTTTAAAFDVTLTFYAGPTYASLTLSDYTVGALPTLTDWTNVSHLVTYNGNLTYQRSGNTLKWTANVQGVGYSATYFAPGQALLCLLSATVAGVAAIDNGLFFLGHILSGTHEDDYRHGGVWQRNVSGLDSYLQHSTAPRIAAGRVNLLETASVTASSTLSTPALEAGTGEFAGALASVAAENTLDGNINTVWISNTVPSSTTLPDSKGFISKLFIKPLAGYDQSKLWWFEINPSDGYSHFNYVKFVNKAGINLWIECTPDRFLIGRKYIICANKVEFEAYVGTVGEIAEIIDVRSFPQGEGVWQGDPANVTDFTLDPDEDYIKAYHNNFLGQVIGAVGWNLTGDPPGIGEPSWAGPALNVVDAPAGWGWLHDADGGNTAADWTLSKFCVPGANSEEAEPEWLLYTLEGQTAVLAEAAGAGAGTIQMSSTQGFPDAGDAICEGDEFTYTGRTVTTLTGVDGILEHASGAAVYPTISGVAQTGMPCSQIEILRRANLPAIAKGRLYMVSTGSNEPRTPGDEDWEDDYDGPVLAIRQHSSSEPVTDNIRDQGFTLLSAGGGARWVKYLLLVIDDMADAGRARLNDVRLHLAQTQIDYSGLGDLDSLNAGDLADYILSLQSMQTPNFANSSSYERMIGEHATAIAPYPQVMDDLARITGCCIDWGLDGNIVWQNDMWWPSDFPAAQLSPRAALHAGYLRDKVQYSGRRPNEVYVRIHARTPDGKREYRESVPFYGITSDMQGIEYTDLVCTTVAEVFNLALSQYYKAGLNYMVGPQEARFTLKGVGEWLRPEQFVTIYCTTSTGETAPSFSASYNSVSWLIESVTWTWGTAGAFRTWTATAQARRYWR